jgi:hypothetical protein
LLPLRGKVVKDQGLSFFIPIPASRVNQENKPEELLEESSFLGKVFVPLPLIPSHEGFRGGQVDKGAWDVT